MTRQGFCLPSEHGDVQMAGKNLAQEYVSDISARRNSPGGRKKNDGQGGFVWPFFVATLLTVQMANTCLRSRRELFAADKYNLKPELI